MLSYEDLKCNFREFSYTHTKTAPASFKVFACRTREGVHEYNHVASAARSLRRPRRAPRLLVSGRTRSTSTSPCAATTRLRPHALYVDLAVRRDYSSPAARTLRRPRRAPPLLVSGRTRSTSTSPCAATTRLRPHALYVDLAVHRDYSSPLSPGCSDLPHLRRVSGCLGTSRGSPRGSSRRSSSTTPPHAGSSSTTSPTPRVRVPRRVARPVTRLIVDYSVRRDFVLRPHWLYFSHAVRCDYLSRGNTGSTSSTPRAATTSSSGRIASTIHLD
jgi:hypothetical protein